jgi:hypothetical protein
VSGFSMNRKIKNSMLGVNRPFRELSPVLPAPRRLGKCIPLRRKMSAPFRGRAVAPAQEVPSAACWSCDVQSGSQLLYTGHYTF